jgi:TorA maturation chaperone TorD
MEDLSKEIERAINYKFLAECFYFPDNKQFEVLSSYKEFIGSGYSEISEYLDSIQDFEPIMVDYTKLFIGPFGLLAAPYGSIYLENGEMLMGNSTINVEDLYAEEGIKVAIKEVPDHIAIELEFMSFLANKKVEAMRVMDEKTIALYHQKQQHFLDIHLGNWIEEFTQKVKKNAQTEFYSKLAQLTREFILNDKAGLLNRN